MGKKSNKIPLQAFERYDEIVLQGVRTHNLKEIDVTIPKNKIITITGVSGSGKSSLAFHTIYKEGQFRYIESLSSYLRQFFNLGTRPDLDYSSGLSPAIAIEQNKRVGNTRSTVGTLTEIDDYLRLLMAKLGEVHCYACGEALRPKTTEQIVEAIKDEFLDQKVYLLQEFGLYEDASILQRRVGKNRKQVDQGGGVTRFLVALNYDKETGQYDDLVEYFYLEDPKIPSDMLPVKVYGVFDRVTINDSTLRRLKDDVIKMLGRADKFGVMSTEGSEKTAKKKLPATKSVTAGASSNIQITGGKKSSESKTYNIILLHGYEGSPDRNWFPWLKEELEAQGHKVSVPALPNSDDPDINKQVNFVMKNGTFDENTIIIGHSAGGVVAQKVIEQLDDKIGGMILVSSLCEPKLKKGLSRDYFATTTWQFETGKILYNANHISVLYDEKDDKIPKSQANKLAKWYETDLQLVKAQGKHFTAEQEPEIFNAVFSMIEELSRDTGSTSLGTIEDEVRWFTDKYYCAKDNIGYPEFGAQHFSANRQEGACPRCQGVGEVLQCDFDKVLDPYAQYLKAILPWRDSNYGQAILKKLAEKYDMDMGRDWKDLPDRFRQVVKEGDGELLRVNTGGGKYVSLYYNGIEEVLTGQYNKGVLTVDFQAMLDFNACPECHGAKLRKESLSVVIHTDDATTYNIYALQQLPIDELVDTISGFTYVTDKDKTLVERICRPLLDRARTIKELGLGYMSTSRKIDSLSGGEIQRLRLAKQLGNKLTGIIYVLDEPTIGLDHGEIVKVIAAIKQLKEMGNTIVVVEHNDAFIKASDWIVEVGPGAGDFGGDIVFNGAYDDFIQTDTLTAQYVNGKKSVTAVFDHKQGKEEVHIKKASKHNLQGIDVSIRLGSFTIITGPSGAGKTTLMYHTFFNFLEEKQKWIQSRIRLALLKEGMSRADIIQAPIMQKDKYEHLQKLAMQEFYEYIGVETITGHEAIENVLYVDQSSIGKTPRSCPATFIGVFDDIRKMFAGVTEAKMLAFTAGHFSFNSSKGACPECNGYGSQKIELHFLPDTYVDCQLCKGRRYKPEILDIRRHDKTISQILDMYVMDALDFFADISFIADKLQLMVDIGLGYLKMGQPAHTLSGGESQRLKLVKHLLKSYKGHTVYFLDEPTVGLHPQDIERLLKVLKKFLDNGDTILMIEHERNLLQFADKVIRLEQGKVVKS